MKHALRRNRLIAVVTGSCALAAFVVAAAAETSVVQWDQFSSSGATSAGPAMEALIKVCEGELKDVKINRTVAPSIGIRDAYRLAVSALVFVQNTSNNPKAGVLPTCSRCYPLLNPRDQRPKS